MQEAYALCWQVVQSTRLLSDKPLDPETLGEGGAEFVLRETGHDSVADLLGAMERVSQSAAKVIEAALVRDGAGATGESQDGT